MPLGELGLIPGQNQADMGKGWGGPAKGLVNEHLQNLLLSTTRPQITDQPSFQPQLLQEACAEAWQDSHSDKDLDYSLGGTPSSPRALFPARV